MIALFGDESYDEHTYVLGGWLITPIHYTILGELWGEMLNGLKLADGSACTVFHAQAIMNQSGIYEGWGKNEAFNAFEQATAVFADRPGRFAAKPCAVATQIPVTLKRGDRNEIWKTLFMRFFTLVLELNPGAQSIEFVFDKKPEIEKYANKMYEAVAAAYAAVLPGAFEMDMNFVHDEASPQIQTADLLLFEWRKSLTARRINPARDDRPWFPKIRAARPGGALVQYDIGKELADAAGVTDPVERAARMLRGPVVGMD